MANFFEKTDRFLDKMCSPKYRTARNMICVFLCFLSLLSIFLLMFSPICTSEDGKYKITAAKAFDSMDHKDSVIASFFYPQFVAYVAIIICMLVAAVLIVKAIMRFNNDDAVASGTRKTIVFSATVVILYTFFTFVFSPINQMLGGMSYVKISYAPVVIVCFTGLLYAVLIGVLVAHRRNKEIDNATAEKRIEFDLRAHRRKLFWHQLEALIFSFATAAIAIITLLSDIVKISFDETEADISDMVISGKEILFGNPELMSKGERLVGFVVFAMMFMTVSLMALSLMSFIGRSQQCNKMITSSVIMSSVACVAIGLFGQYYKMIQELNAEVVENLLEEYNLPLEELLVYEIESGAIKYSYILVGILIVFFLRRPLTKASDEYRELSRYDGLVAPAAEVTVSNATIEINSGDDEEEELLDGEFAGLNLDEETTAPTSSSDTKPKKPDDFDPCPAFTEIDKKIGVYMGTLKRRRENLLENPTLPNLVNYIVQYARDSKHHLFYTPESIATFIAGLGVSRLTILQGMSGTGKTSLPKIVAEALMSVCDIVEVESSWRDKNELLGYYNEFNKVYTPRKFTQALYRACLNPDTITFIVLDEMNLSRIEYYFSDFLSLMENEPDKRTLQLLNTPISRIENGEKKNYTALIDCHTVKIPGNVWFIGTANRDESTYDISDKVYDRAHTMNFDKRAQKPAFFGNPSTPKYLPANELLRLFDEACKTVRANIDNYPVVHEVEALLEPYNISFGNRIAMQIERFVNIYSSCFTYTEQTVLEALDIILLSKVVKKLELKSVDDKESLSHEFEKIGLRRCASFILSLKED